MTVRAIGGILAPELIGALFEAEEMTEILLHLFWPAIIVLGLAGWGAAYLAIFAGKPVSQEPNLIVSAFFGLFIVTFGALLTNFWLGLGKNPGVFTLGFGLIFVLIQCIKKREWQNQVIFVVVVASAIAVCFRHMRFSYDAGLYHIPYMDWVAQGPVPLGLANLEGRLGFNSAWLLFVSVVRIDTLSGWTDAIHAEIAMRALAIGYLTWKFYRELCKGWTRSTVLFGTASAVVFIYLLVFGRTTSTDDAANLCAVIAWVIFSECLLGPSKDVDGNLALVLLLAVLAVAIKVSMIPVMALPVFLIIREIRLGKPIATKTFLLFSGMLGLFGSAWLTRSVLLSGCAIFPAASTCIPTPWAVPIGDVIENAATIMGWARAPGPGYQAAMEFWTMDWIALWLVRTTKSIPFASVFCAGMFAAGVFFFLRKRVASGDDLSEKYHGWLAITIVTVTAGIILWLVKAPAPRYSWAFFSILCTTLACAAIYDRNFALPAFGRERKEWGRRLTNVSAPIYAIVIVIAMLGWRPAKVPVVQVEQWQSSNGWAAWHPIEGDQCWTNFPCSPYPIVKIEAKLVGERWIFKPAVEAK